LRQAVVLVLVPLLFAQNSSGPRRVDLPTSKVLTLPAPGYLVPLNGFTPTIAVSPDGRYAALLNDGYGSESAHGRQSIAVLDLQSNQLATFPDDRFGEEARQSYFIGLAFGSKGSELYASVGSITDPMGAKSGDLGNGIAVYHFQDGKISAERFLKMPPQPIAVGKRIAVDLNQPSLAGQREAIPYPAGLAVVRGKPDELLVANNLSDSVVLLNTVDGRVVKSFDVSTHEIIPNSYPHSVVVSRDGRRAWCSLWNASRVAELDLEAGKVRGMIPLLAPEDPSTPGSHPTAMLLSPDEKYLYVALSNASRVAVVSAESGEVVRTLDTEVPGQHYAGSSPVALAQSQDGARLYVADASLNAVAVFDHPSDTPNRLLSPAGMIPTDWYPSALAMVGSDLLIATSKGKGTGPNIRWDSGNSKGRHHGHIYIANLLYGSLARLQEDDVDKRLPELTRAVQEANLMNTDIGRIFPGGTNPIHHVIYILKENRTYDQILGDLQAGNKPIGNGDPSLTLYGAEVTPNLHKIALQFGVIDNFYDSGEVSGDGHVWSTAATTSDYNENTWQISYRGHERTYDFQGNVAGESPLEQKRPDIDAPGTGFLWDSLAAHHLTYRDYGEFVDGIWCKPEPAGSPKEGTASPLEAGCAQSTFTQGATLPATLGDPRGSVSPWPWVVPALHDARAAKAALRDHLDPNYPDFETSYPDQLRADEFLNEFADFVTARKRNQENNSASRAGELPQFVLLYLPDDHTGGTRVGKPRPAASVADNDLAVGRVVDAVSHSPYWNDTAIFIVEDDAQDGADHVDAHRSIAFVVSKYSPGSSAKPFVDSRFYTTVNMLHTIESLLGLPPMNQNDGYAPLMAPLFTGAGSQPAFTADYANRDNGLIYQVNSPKTDGAKESAKMDFTHPDANDAHKLNAILWRDRKGNAAMPASQHNVFPKADGADRD
jgi:DNA-binding beta-propeller fold protein YncE